MIPVKQTTIASIDGSVRGNCMAACLASILELDINDVPQPKPIGEDWFPELLEFLHSYGYEFDGTSNDWPISYDGVDGYLIAHGDSHREHVKTGHSVVYKNGEMVHDPHPDDSGLRSIQGFFLIRRMSPDEKNEMTAESARERLLKRIKNKQNIKLKNDKDS